MINVQLKEDIDLVSIIEKITRRKAKSNGTSFYIEPCPLCNDTDCFKIYPKEQCWVSFCKGLKNYDLIDFIKFYEGIETKEALIKANSLTNIDFTKTIKQLEEKERLQELLNIAVEYYHNKQQHPHIHCQIALGYPRYNYHLGR